MNTIEPQNAKFVAEVGDVRELRLIGNADHDFWNRRFADKPYQAFADGGGQAEITICATELVLKGFQFNELTISLSVAAKDNSQRQIAYLLLHAFNSNRFFAICERAFFSTPYHFGKVNLRETTPCAIHARSKNRNVLKAEMSQENRLLTEEDELWEGAVLLPNTPYEKYFIAKLSGKSKVFPFIETDRIELQSDVKHTVFDLLINSNFAGKEWRARGRAFHAKSKTYRA